MSTKCIILTILRLLQGAPVPGFNTIVSLASSSSFTVAYTVRRPQSDSVHLRITVCGDELGFSPLCVRLAPAIACLYLTEVSLMGLATHPPEEITGTAVNSAGTLLAATRKVLPDPTDPCKYPRLAFALAINIL